MRRDGEGARAVADLADALHEVDAGLTVREPDSFDVDVGADARVITRDGHQLVVRVRTARRPTPAAVTAVINTLPPGAGSVSVMVADTIMPAVRKLLKDAGWSWLDRSGHLRFWTDRLMIDTPVACLLVDSPRAPSLTSPASQELALLLLAKGAPVGVRAAAGLLERSTSTMSGALRMLRAASMVGADGAPVMPELFWALAEQWGARVRPLALAGMPDLDDTRSTDQLNLGLDNPEKTVGWALRGPVAAAAWGAKAPLSGGYPPDFFVPDERALRVATWQYSRAPERTERACTVAIAPSRWIVRHRFDLAGRNLATTRWPAVHPVVAALDLAQDPRGRETLEDFDPPTGWTRAW